MATKSDKYPFVEQSFTTAENQYYKLNLNQSKKCTTLIPVQFNSKPNNDKNYATNSIVSENYKEKEKLQLWNKSPKVSTFKTLNEDNDDLKNRWKNENTLKNTNKSTLSLRIAVYENSVASNLFGENENIEGLKREKFGSIKEQCFSDSLKSQNPFEFPRQQNGDQRNKPEVMQFRASQRLRSSSRPSTATPLCRELSNMGRNSTKKTPKKTPAKKTKKYVVEKILNKRLIGNTLEYLIKWKSYSHSENSWEPAANCDCPDVIKQFEKEQKSKNIGKKRSAPVAASQNSGPSAKRTRSAAPASSTPRTRRRTSTASTQRSETPSSSAGLIQLNRNRRNTSSTPKLVPQQVSFEFSSSPNNSALSPVNYSPDEVQVSTHYPTAERVERRLPLERTRDASSSSDIIFVETVNKNDQSLPATELVVKDDEDLPANGMLTPHVEDGVVSSYSKPMQNADKNIRMAQELLKCPDLFYVFISLGILKDNLRDNHKELLYEIKQLKNKGDELAHITDKVEEIKVIHDEIEAALENLHPSSRLAQNASSPQDTIQDVEDQSAAAVEDDKGTQILDTVEDETVLDSTPKSEVAEEESATDVDTQVLDTVQDETILGSTTAPESGAGNVVEKESAAVEGDKTTSISDTVQDKTILDSTPKNEANVIVSEEEPTVDGDKTTLSSDTVQGETNFGSTTAPESVAGNVVEEEYAAAVDGDKNTPVLDTVHASDEAPVAVEGDKTTLISDTVQGEATMDSKTTPETEKNINVTEKKSPAADKTTTSISDTDDLAKDEVSGDISSSGSLPELNNIENLGAAESAKTIEGESKSNEEKVVEEL